MKRSLMSKMLLAVLALVMVVAMLPVAAMAAPVTHTLNMSDLEVFDAVGEDRAGEYKELDDYYTVFLGKNTRLDENSKTFDDGFSGTKRLNFQGKSEFKDDGPQKVLMFKAEGAGTAKIWWRSGGDGRNVAIYDENGIVLDLTKPEDSVKDTNYITELEIASAGTYYLGCPEGSNYYFKVEVTVEVAEEEPEKEAKTLVIGDKTYSTDNWIYNEATDAAGASKLGMLIYDKNYEGEVVTNGWGGAIVLDKYGKLVKIYDGANVGFWTEAGKSTDPLTFNTSDYSTVAFSELADGEMLIVFPHSGGDPNPRAFALGLRDLNGDKPYCGKIAALTGFEFEAEPVDPPVEPEIPEAGDTAIFFVLTLMTVAMAAVVVLTKKQVR